MPSLDSLGTRRTLTVGTRTLGYYSLEALASQGVGDIATLPHSIKVLVENLLRQEDGKAVTKADILAAAAWDAKAAPSTEIAFMPARILLQDFTGVPCVVDLASMRDAIASMGGDPARINPLLPADLVVDHSVQVDAFGTKAAFEVNAKLEMERNRERYQLLRWGQQAFANFRVVPPDTGIVHQVNIEYLARVAWTATVDGQELVYPDTVVGTDSHTTMVNGLGVVGWGVGGIEAEAAMLGQPVAMLLPQVVGFKLVGRLAEGATATDLVLTVTQMLRKKGVVGKFVEFFGPGVRELSLPDRATVANMAPEYGATIGYFPVDAETLAYLRFTGRDEAHVQLVEAHARAQGLFHDSASPAPRFSDVLELDLATVEPSLAGPKRPQDRVALSSMRETWRAALPELLGGKPADAKGHVEWPSGRSEIGHGAVVIASITSCTNTSNPAVLVAAGLLAKKAVAKGLKVKPWVKTSLAPGSLVVTEYLRDGGLLDPLEALGFHVVGYGCMTCIGNSGPLPEPVAKAVTESGLVAAAVLSGNRNFEGRVNALCKANYLASPPLVVAYALAGTVDFDAATEPLGEDHDGKPVYLKDVWPTQAEIREQVRASVRPDQFSVYANVLQGPPDWRTLEVPEGTRYAWDPHSTYVRHPPYFDDVVAGRKREVKDVYGARVLAMLGDSITTDHISPAGNISKTSPAAKYLQEHGVAPADFNTYGARRGNHQVMVRGTFANIRLRNEIAPGTEGGFTRFLPTGDVVTIFEASERYRAAGTPLVVIAGKEYGSGSSRDWAAKGPFLLGVVAVVAESFERIHRSNLIGMGVLPLEFMPGESRKSLGLTGEEILAIEGLAAGVQPRQELEVLADGAAGPKRFRVRSRIDTLVEVDYFNAGGILPFVLGQLAVRT